jgi:DNA adenine methylase
MNSPFPWPGGKRALKKTLLTLIPEHSIYAEVFAGSAKLLFAKERSQFEVMNDLNGEITNFFRVVKHRTAELAERLELECVHAGRFVELKRGSVPLDEVDRALRFAYLLWYSFGAKGQHYASNSARNPQAKRPLDSVRELLKLAATRLAGVVIEQRDFGDILARYDSPGTFFYLDPPYVAFQSNGQYDPLTAERRVEMFRSLKKIKGRFLLSFDDHPEVRQLAKAHAFKVKRVDVVYTISGRGHGKPSPELLIANYQLEKPAA